jgi:serine/threonine-protein kinase
MALAIEQELPLAPASQVGQWVEKLGGEILAERALRIAEVEGAPEGTAPPPRVSRPPDAASVATAPGRGRPEPDEPSLVATRQMTRNLARAPVVDAAQTDTSLVSSDLEKPPRTRRAYVAGASLAALLVVGGGLVLASRSSPPVVAQGLTPSAPATQESSAPSAQPTAAGSTAAPATAVADDAIQPSALPLAPPAPHGPRPAMPTRHAQPPAGPPLPGCDPPYTVDANGYRKYKRECAN